MGISPNLGSKRRSHVLPVVTSTHQQKSFPKNKSALVPHIRCYHSSHFPTSSPASDFCVWSRACARYCCKQRRLDVLQLKDSWDAVGVQGQGFQSWNTRTCSKPQNGSAVYATIIWLVVASVKKNLHLGAFGSIFVHFCAGVWSLVIVTSVKWRRGLRKCLSVPASMPSDVRCHSNVMMHPTNHPSSLGPGNLSNVLGCLQAFANFGPQ